MDERNDGPRRRQAKQTVCQTARHTALEAQVALRAYRAETDRRPGALGVTVLVAIGVRNAAEAACKQRGGQALLTMTDTERLSLREASAWCGPGPNARDAAPLRDFMTRTGADAPKCSRGPRHPRPTREFCDD
jgi:hypothetical protein